VIIGHVPVPPRRVCCLHVGRFNKNGQRLAGYAGDPRLAAIDSHKQTYCYVGRIDMRLALELLRMHFRKPTSFAVQTWNPISR